jgi:NADH-quinone oxidoreductase subunit N
MVTPAFVFASAEIFLSLASVFILLVAVFRRKGTTTFAAWAVVGVFSIAAILILSNSSDQMKTAFFGLFITSPHTEFVKILILVCSALTVILSNDYLKREEISRFEFPILIVFATLGMMIIVSAGDLITLYLGIELQSLACYVLVSIRTDSFKSIKSGFKYFLIGLLSSIIFLYGCSLIYVFSGATEFIKISQSIDALEEDLPIGFIIGLIFVILGLASKISIIPFQTRFEDCDKQAPVPVTIFLLVGPKIAVLSLLIQFLAGHLWFLFDQWQYIIIALASISMFFPSLMMLFEDNLKRLFVYGATAQTGFALMGLATGSDDGFSSILIYFCIYLTMNFGVFAIILSMRQKKQAVDSVRHLAGLSKSHPFLAFSLLVAIFSMAGIPPFAGFLAKWFILISVMDEKLYLLLFMGITTSCLAAVSYLRILKIMYLDELSEPLDSGISNEAQFVIFTTIALLLLFSFVPDPLISVAKAAVSYL